jgi:uncharacterized membrane protein SpoIIM required for sporulation
MEQTADAAQALLSPKTALDDLFDRRRLLLILAVLIVEIALFVAGILTPIPSSARQSLENQTSTQFASVPTATPPQLFSLIFTHNLPFALLEMIPVLGALVFVSSIYITGIVAQVSAAAYGYPGQFGAVLLIFPYSLVEFSAYAIAVGAGIMLLISWRRGRLGRELRVFVLEMVAVAVVLCVAAIMETLTKFLPLMGLALWIPTALAVVGIVVYSGRKRA